MQTWRFYSFFISLFWKHSPAFLQAEGLILLGLLQLVQEKHKIWTLQMHKCKKKNSSRRQKFLKVWSTLFLCKEQLGRSWDFFNKFCLMRKQNAGFLSSFPHLVHVSKWIPLQSADTSGWEYSHGSDSSMGSQESESLTTRQGPRANVDPFLRFKNHIYSDASPPRS